MKYNTSEIRKQNKALDLNKATEILTQGELGILSMVNEDKQPYGVPLNYATDSELNIYIHCAKKGYKNNCLKTNDRVSFCVVGNTHVISEKFTTQYQSIIVEGKAQIIHSTDEKMKAFELILDKYSPNEKVEGMKYATRAIDSTEIIKIKIIKWSGKGH